MRVSSPVTKHNPRPRKYASAAARQAAYRARNEMLEFRAEPHTAETLTRIADTIDVSRSDLLLSMVKYALANHDWARFGLTHKTIPYYQGNPIMATKKPTPAQLAARARFAEMARSGAFKKKRKANPDIYAGVYSKAQKAAAAAQDGELKIGNEVYKLKFNRSEWVYNVTDKDGNYVVNINEKSLAKAKKFLKEYMQNPRSRKKTVSQKVSQLVHEGYPQRQAVAVALSEQRAGKVKRNPIGEKHWILTQSTVQNIIENLDRNLMTLKAAKNYFSAYGVEIKGGSKREFIRNLVEAAGMRKSNPTAKTRGKVSAVVLMKNPAAQKKLWTVHRADANGSPVYHIAHFSKKADAVQYAKAYADHHGKKVVITSKAV